MRSEIKVNCSLQVITSIKKMNVNEGQYLHDKFKASVGKKISLLGAEADGSIIVNITTNSHNWI